MSGHKLTQEIAAIRRFREGRDITNLLYFSDIRSKDDLKVIVDHLKTRILGKSIGVKLLCDV